MEDALAADLVVPFGRAGTVAEQDRAPWGFRASNVPLPIASRKQRLNAMTTRRVARSSSMTRISPPTLRNVFPLLGSTRLAEAAPAVAGRAGAARALADSALAQVKEDGHE